MKALVCVDVQHDFMPGGALAVPAGYDVVGPLLQLANEVDVVVATQDWHPSNHCSFKSEGGLWPAHCIMGTIGAQIVHHIDMVSHYVVRKGFDADAEEYSGGERVGSILNGHMSTYGSSLETWDEVIVGGVATEYCVKATAMDLAGMGFPVTVEVSACRGISPEASLLAIAQMKEVSVHV